jgi:hypothetical protein
VIGRRKTAPGGARLMLALATIAATLALAAPVAAETINPYVYSGKFIDGTGSSAGPFEGQIYFLDINQTNGRVYVQEDNFIQQFSAGGTPIGFSAQAGANTISQPDHPWGGLAVNPINGNIYAGPEGGPISGYNENGGTLPEFPLAAGYNCGLATDLTTTDFWMANWGSNALQRFHPNGSFAESIESPGPCEVAVDTDGYVYGSGENGPVRKYSPTGQFLYTVDETASAIAVDPSDNSLFVLQDDRIRHYDVSSTAVAGEGPSPAKLLTTFGEPDPGRSYLGLQGGTRDIAVNGTSGEVYVAATRSYAGRSHVEIFEPLGEVVIPNVETLDPEVEPTTAVLHGTVNADGGGETTDCYFEWGPDTSYGSIAPCEPPGPFSGTADNPVSAEVSGLVTGTTYHFRIVAENAEGIPARGADAEFKPSGPPAFSNETVTEVNTDGVRLSATIDPGGSTTEYHLEYGTADCESSPCTSVPVPDKELAKAIGLQNVTHIVTGLTPGTEYHWRVVATNDSATSEGSDHTFRTFPSNDATDRCDNAEVRKQTGAGLLLDCRAYELASATYTGGYDVVNDLIVGQTPLLARPGASGRVVYSVHRGTIPGVAGNPPNLGLDPYVATRGEGGWTTRYVGIGANQTPSLEAFGSPLLAADSGLSAFAFGGANLCDPCFADGTSGIPVRLANGKLVQGMAGSMSPAGAEPAGFIAEPLSADGSHLVFGATEKFETDGLSGALAIYDRNLLTGTTRVVSKEADGSGTMAGGDLGELGISEDGSRILLGREVSTDGAGNTLWHLYMNVGAASKTIDLTPGTTSGVLFGGMTDDGSQVLFTTVDKLGDGDADSSADVYRADVGAATSSLSRVTTTNSDACAPVAGKDGPRWNRADANASCDAVLPAGGAGVASGDGTVFLLSPETLGGEGVADQPNLFVVTPGGSPELVATIEPDGTLVRNAVANNELVSFGDIQVTGEGGYAVLASTRSLTGFANLGRSQVFRYETGSGQLTCSSCAPTGGSPLSDTRLSSVGLNVSDDGRVFFTTADQLVLRDTNKQRDAYEWKDGVVELISTGSSGTASGLLSVSTDGADVFFFTRQVLSAQDRNGSAMKIYDAREDGGFFTDVESPPCQASDECHGPGTEAAAPPQISTLAGDSGNFSGAAPVKCKKPKVKRNGKCVKKSKKKKKKKKRSSRRNGGKRR